ncbi:hypothetical protein X777_16747 [Ooceraea biroi]|uniref:Uncharacterized protein n=1 Tax=Ooceraea biroi TaxID=2015173 RepID=A0A026VTK3_OOCBI|nr:hypothetical protein X777_16747 [Ooceraea biroi]
MKSDLLETNCSGTGHMKDQQEKPCICASWYHVVSFSTCSLSRSKESMLRKGPRRTRRH